MADPEASQDYTSDAVAVLDYQTNLGQSFVSRRPHLNGITLWLTTSTGQPDSSANALPGTIRVILFRGIGEPSPVFSTTINTPASGNNIPITISLPNQADSEQQNYYLFLSKNSGSIQINGRNEDSYPLGQAYINGNPVDADVAFRLSYDYDLPALMQDFKQFAASSWIIIPLLTLLWLPGWLFLDISRIRPRFDFGECIALSIGLSLALIPVVMLWTTSLKVKWSREAVLFVSGLLLVLFVLQLFIRYISRKRNNPIIDNDQSSELSIPHSNKYTFISTKSVVLLLIFLGSLTVRLIMVRDLATPAWVDSVHHALITRLILNAGAYPSTFLPYLNISPSAYHQGFHSIAAAFIWLTNLDLARSLLILGQVLNAVCVFSVYLFATTLTRSSSAGLVAAFVAGFLTPMPAYYTSWGRYTELTGLLVLPVVLALVKLWLDEKLKGKTIWIILLGAIAGGGLFMIHYRVLVFLVVLIISYVLIQIIPKKQSRQAKPARVLLFVLSMAFLAMILVFPWLIQTLKEILIPKVNLQVTASVSFFQDFSWPFLTSALGKQAMVVAGLGLLWSLIKRRSFSFIISLWVLLIFLLANLDALKLPGGGLITNLSVEIMLFIPISILAGYMIDQILSHWMVLIPKRLIIPSIVLIYLLFGFIAYSGARQLIPIINPVTILSRNADLSAIEWVSRHIPENETIVINPFSWGYGIYAGNDGGYWIEPLTGKLTLTPPVLYGLGSGIKEINQQSQQVWSLSPDPAKLWEYLTSQHMHYVYIGARGGVIPPEKLASSGLFDVLYHQAGVWIFSIKP